MNSIISDDLTREHFALQAAKCIENIYAKSRNVTSLHKELLEINLSIIAYIEESKRRLEDLRLDLAHEATSSYKVVEILSEKQYNMPKSPATPHKCNQTKSLIKSLQEDNNNTNNKFTDRQRARTFIQWYKHMIDHERHNITLYLSDNTTLEWFGRTIRSKKKVTAFLKYDMQCSRHDFTTVDSIEKIQTREENIERKELLASPLNSPELIKQKERCGKKRALRSNCSSPEWADDCKPEDEKEISDRKKFKPNHTITLAIEPKIDEIYQRNCLKRDSAGDEESEINSKGDGMLERCVKRKCLLITPPNLEVGQGDCMPSTSGIDSSKSHNALNAQLPKLAVECNGYIEFNRTRNNRSTDSMKWERKCKVQISYSEDPLNIGEYIIWALRYTDESKCRRNLLAAFEEIAEEDQVKRF